MNEQHAEMQCDICHQLLDDDSPAVVIKCRHRYHRQCLSSNGEMNNIKCPLCTDENAVSSSMSNRIADVTNTVLQTTNTLSTLTPNESKISDNSSFEVRSSHHCTSDNSPNLTKSDVCKNPRITDSTNKYKEIMTSHNNYDPSTSSYPEFVTAYTTDSANDYMKSSPSVFEKNPISEQIPKQHVELPMVWECEVCTYENELTVNLCPMCKEGRRPYALTQSISNHNSPQLAQSDDLKYSFPVVEKNPISKQMFKEQDESPRDVWNCEMCTYRNERTANLCSMCRKGQRPYALTQSISDHHSPQPTQSDGPKLSSKSYSILSQEEPITEIGSTILSIYNKISKLPITTSVFEKESIVFIPDLPFHKSDTELEKMIQLRLSNDHRVNVTKVKCYSNIGVGIIYVADERDKNDLVKNLRLTILDSQTNAIIHFVEHLELISYLVLDQNMKAIVTSDQVAHRWQQLSRSSQLLTIEIVDPQFPNIFKIVSHSLDELLAIQNVGVFAINKQVTQIYLNADCSFFEDLPQNTTASQILVAINAQIGGQYDESSLYVQYNKDVSNAIVLATKAARTWTNILYINLNNQSYMKTKRLAFRLVLHPLPREIPTDIVTQDQQFQNAVSHSTRIEDKLIIEVKDKSVYDKFILAGAMRIKDHSVLVEPFTKLINDPENMEINAETWYETQMLDYQPDLKQFIDNPQHPIFKYKWNNQKWLEQFKRYEGIHGDDNDRQRRLLRVTVMLNTIGILWKKRYTLEIKNKQEEIKLNLERMKNIIYNHRSKLENTKEISTRLSTPFPSTIVKVVNEDCLVVYQRLASERNHPVLLNMANAQTPGGGYRRGAGAQEENVFRRSNYYLSLDMELDHNKQADRYWCTANCDEKSLETNQKFYPIEEYGAIYTSGITVFRDTEDKGYAYLEQPVYGVCSIASAAYCRPGLKRNNPNMLKNKFTVDTRKKIENFFAIAHHHGHDCLVLSAFGCGAFRNPPKHIAMIFKSVIEQYAGYFKQIYFSIIDDHNTGNQHNPDGNFRPFKSILDDFTVQPSKGELDVNMISGPYRILSKNQGKLTIDQVKIFDLPPCKYASLCHDLHDTKHCQSYSHPPLCSKYDSCNQSGQDDVHLSSFIHRTNCSHGGLCKSIEDEKHLRLYNHPEFCSDCGFCTNMDKNHLIKFRHVNLCKDRLKCLSYLKKDPDHCRSYRHCLLNCSYGDYCVNFHDKEHWDDQTHPFRTPCPLTPFACQYHIEYLQAKNDSSARIKASIEEHCIFYSHVCPFGRQCRDQSSLHTQISIHIARNVCPNSTDCKNLSNEEHLNCFTHPHVHDIRFVCKYSNSECRDRWNRDHILRYRHIGKPDHIGIARYSGLNKDINFVRNQNELIKRLRQYTESQKWKQPKDHVEEITEWIRALQPVHRCNKSIFQSILVHGHAMSRKYMERLRQAEFVANAVDQHPKVRKILNHHNNTVLQRYAKDFIRALVAIEFDKNAPAYGDPARLQGVAAALHQPYVRNEQIDMVRMRESQLKLSLTPDEINSIRRRAIRIAEASLELHKNPMGIGHVPDELFGTNDHVFSILGPNLGSYYGDIFIIFKHELMFHPDSNFSIQAATTYGQSANAYKNRPWLKDPGTMKDRVQCFHWTKLHCSLSGYDYAAAMELMAMTGLKKKTMDVKLKDVIDHWMHIDPHEVFEAHLPQLIPLDYIDHVYIPKSLFNSLSTYAQRSAKETFRHNLTITDHDVDRPLDPKHQSYERYVQDEVRKKIENNKNARCHRGTIITLPATMSSLVQYICIPMTISQSFHQYQSTNYQNDTIFIYWQALGGDMMLAISQYRIDPSRDQSNNPCLLCYIADIPSNNNNINDYRESYSYITNSQPDSHDMLVQSGHFKAKSNTFHRGCNIYDYITYCLRIKRKTGEVTLIHAGANSIYNHQTINYTFQRSQLDVIKLDYIHVSACHRVVPIRNLVIRHEPIEEYHPSFDKKFKEGSDPITPPPKSPGVAAAAQKGASKNDQGQEEKSLLGYLKDKIFGKDDQVFTPCRDSIYCLLQYSREHSESHNKKYSHPCRFSELCRSKSDHPHLEHTPHPVSLCRYDQNCRARTDPVHRAQYRHTDLSDFLIPCRYQTHCKDKNRPEHRIKYFHGEKIPLPSSAAARPASKNAYNDDPNDKSSSK